MSRSTIEITKIEDELKLIIEARATFCANSNLNQGVFITRISQLYLTGAISDATYKIANFLYGKETSLTPPATLPFTPRGGC